jgi:hypothetical protein
MEKNNITNLRYEHTKKIKNRSTSDCKIYTLEMAERYKEYQKKLLKITNDKTRTQFMIYKKVYKWYEEEDNLNINMERIYIKSKLDSYTFGG